MTARIAHTTIDSADAYALSEWWKPVLDYVDVDDDPNEPGDEECMIISRDGVYRLLFITVPESKTVKNRLHIDLEPVDGRRDDELARLIAHGAVQVADHRGKYGPGTGWVVMADPEGNEFCILRNAGERSQAPPGTEEARRGTPERPGSSR